MSKDTPARPALDAMADVSNLTTRLRELMEEATPGPICESALVPLYAVQDYDYNEVVAAFAEFDDEGELTMQFQGEKAKANLALYTVLVNNAPTILRLLEALEKVRALDAEARLAQANEALMKHAVSRHVRMAPGGCEVPSGFSCDLCDAETDDPVLANFKHNDGCILSPTPPAQSAGEALDPADTGAKTEHEVLDIIELVGEFTKRAAYQLEADKVASFIRAQASALAEARRSALEEAAKVVEGQSTAANYMPLNEPLKMIDWVTRRDFRVAGLIRALTEPQHGNG